MAEASRERLGGDLLQTASAIASVLGFLISLCTLVPYLGAGPSLATAAPDVLRQLSPERTTAVLIFSTPIFGVLVSVLVISLARMTLSLLRRSGVEVYGDAGGWLLLLLVAMPVATGANLFFAIVLFGSAQALLPILCIAANLVLAGYCTFRWLQNTLH